MSAQHHRNRSGLVEDLNAAIRDNPLAAGLIGAGALWMLFGRKGIAAAAGGAGFAAGKVGAAAWSSGRSAAQAIGSTGSSVASSMKNAASRGIDSVASIVPDLSTSDPALDNGVDPGSASHRSGPDTSMTSSAGRYASNLKSTVADTFERQPLLLGAVGLAIGAAIAASFATTAIESEWIGEQGAAAREKVKQAAKDVTDRAWQAGKDEAQKQNLTAEAGWDAAESLIEKTESVVKAGRDSLQTAVGR